MLLIFPYMQILNNESRLFYQLSWFCKELLLMLVFMSWDGYINSSCKTQSYTTVQSAMCDIIIIYQKMINIQA